MNADAIRESDLVLIPCKPHAKDVPEFIVGRPLHSSEHTAWAVARFPLVNVCGEASPAPEVEVPHTEVRPRRKGESIL